MEIPKRKFALEEKDLSEEADENNKIAEERKTDLLQKYSKRPLKILSIYQLIKF